MKSLNVIMLLVISAAMAVAVRAEESERDAAVSYYRDVRPIFQAHCQGCHQPAKPSGEYVMTDFARLLKGGESGRAGHRARQARQQLHAGAARSHRRRSRDAEGREASFGRPSFANPPLD